MKIVIYKYVRVWTILTFMLIVNDVTFTTHIIYLSNLCLFNYSVSPVVSCCVHSMRLLMLEFLCALFFQVTASEALPASMFIPVPSPERESQSTPHATANSNSEDTKKQAG